MPRSPVNSTSVFLYDSTLSGMRYLVWGMSYLVGYLGFPGGSDGKEFACNMGDLSSIPGLGRSPGGGKGYPFHYSCLENPMDRGAWQATVYGVVKSQTQLSNQAQHMDKYKVVCIGGGMIYRASLVAQLVKNPPAMRET